MPGEQVILNWATPCMRCFQCQEGNQHICERHSPVVAGGNGATPGHAHPEGTRWRGQALERSFNLGTLSEYALVKASALVKVAVEDLNFAAAAIVSCGVMTGYGSVVNAARLAAGSSAVVLGCGGVGLNVIQGCRVAGAARIVAVDVNPNKLELAKKFGATDVLLADKNDKGLLGAAAQVQSMLNGRGADYAFECTAIPALGAAPLAMIRNAGTAVQVSGIEEEITIDMRLFEWDKVYINPLYGKCRPQIDFPKIMNLYQGGELLLEYQRFADTPNVGEVLLGNRDRLPALRFDCGISDPLIEANRELHGVLEADNLPHEYTEFPGGHEWPYWREHLVETLRFFKRHSFNFF